MNWPLSAGKLDFVHTNNQREVTTRRCLRHHPPEPADPLKLISSGRTGTTTTTDGDGDYHVTQPHPLRRLIYELDDHHSVYASYSDIFTPQSAKDTSGNPVKPIVGKNYEVGIKGEYPRRAERQRGAVSRRPGKPRRGSGGTELPAAGLS